MNEALLYLLGCGLVLAGLWALQRLVDRAVRRKDAHDEAKRLADLEIEKWGQSGKETG